MFNFSKLSHEEYIEKRYDFILQAEENGKIHLRPYNDGEGWITIGIGFNLASENVREKVLSTMGIKDASLIESLTLYLSARLSPTNTENSTIRKLLDDTVGIYTSGSKFEFDSDSQVKALFTGENGEEGLVEEYEKRVDDWAGQNKLGAIPKSRERIALLSLAYNGVLAHSKLLAEAIKRGDRAEAWYQIRYQSNRTSLSQAPVNGVHGLAKRRYYEAEMFGLYDASTDPAQTERDNARRMVESNRTIIDAYEARYGVTSDGRPGQRNMIAAANHDYQLTGALLEITTIQQVLASLESEPEPAAATVHAEDRASARNGMGNSSGGGGCGNVLINGRTAVHAGSCGTLTTIDVCYTKIGKPIKEIAYTNIAKSADAAGTSSTVFVNGHPVCHKNSVFAKSTGDEPGDRLGVLSGTIMAQADFITFSSNVFFEGMEATRQADLMVSNNKNTAPMPLMQPSGPPPAALKKAEAQSRAATDSPFKIAVEIAGANPDNMKGVLVAKSDEITGETPIGSTARIGGHRRELFIENLPEGRYDLVQRFFDRTHTTCEIPLGRQISTCGKEAEKSEWETILVPVIPRSYISAEPGRLEASYPRCDKESRTGWLYIYLDGRLWRELQVLPEGSVKDVNLLHAKGLDKREATSTADYVIVLPYKVDGKEPLIEMCYSEVQWDWARIDALGGMAEDDPRQEEETAVPSGDGSETAVRLRAERMQRIDLSDYPHFTRTDGPVGAADEFPPDHPKRNHIEDWRESGQPVVYLHDPLGIANALSLDIAGAYGRLTDTVNKMQTLAMVDDPALSRLSEEEKATYFRTALLAYKTFFEPRNAYRRIAESDHIRSAIHCHTQGAVKSDIGAAREAMDEDYLKRILAVESRAQCRKEILEKRSHLADYLQGRHNGASIREKCPDFIDVNAAVLDYAYRQGPAYLLLWERVSSLITFFNHDPGLLDFAYDLSTVASERMKPAEDPGFQYLTGLLDPSHPLHAALYPSADQVDMYSADVKADILKDDAQPEATSSQGAFRSIAFASAVLAERKIGPYRMAEAVVKQGEGVVSNFLAAFQRQWDLARATGSNERVSALLRLGKAAKVPELAGMHLVPAGSELGDRVVIDAKVRSMEILNRAERRRMAATGAKIEGAGVSVVDPRTGKALGILDASGVRQYRGAPRAFSSLNWAELWGKTGKVGNEMKLVQVGFDALVVPVDSPYAVKYHNPDLAASPGVTVNTKLLRGLSKTLPPLVAVFEGWNFFQAKQALSRNENPIKNRVTFRATQISAIYASIDAGLKVFGHEKMFETLSKLGKFGQISQRMMASGITVGGTKILWFNPIAGGASLGLAGVHGLSAAMAAWGSIERFLDEDYDAAGAYALSAGGFAGAALAALGGKGGLAALGFLGPYGLALFGLGLGAGLLAIALTDSDLDTWAKYGPFSKNISDRMSRQFQDKGYKDAYAVLMNKFMFPRASVRRDFARQNDNGSGIVEPDIVVDVIAPGFEPESSVLKIETDWEKQVWGVDVRGRAEQRVAAGIWTPQEPYEIEPIYNEHGALEEIGVRYRYYGVAGRWQAQVQHVNSEGVDLKASKVLGAS